jgi:hypothetical protein
MFRKHSNRFSEEENMSDTINQLNKEDKIKKLYQNTDLRHTSGIYIRQEEEIKGRTRSYTNQFSEQGKNATIRPIKTKEKEVTPQKFGPSFAPESA